MTFENKHTPLVRVCRLCIKYKHFAKPLQSNFIVSPTVSGRGEMPVFVGLPILISKPLLLYVSTAEDHEGRQRLSHGTDTS